MTELSGWAKAPMPYFGGKRHAASAVWEALGDVSHYVEPFAGSLAVLLNRPHEANRPYFSETVNDADGLLVNVWRAIQLDPEATAFHASNPVAEADLHARHSALVRWRNERQLEHLMGDPDFHDAKMAGWWLFGIACWIGGSWCAGDGAWVPDADGRLVKQERGPSREPGVSRRRPFLTTNGQGVNSQTLREPGVSRQRPHLIGNGQGVNHAGLREPGLDFHEVTMPKLLEWFAYLSARLRHVRILNGDWSRLVTSGATKTLMVRGGKGVCGVFLDPPYSGAADRADNLYAEDSTEVAHEVRAWCLAHGDDPEYRIVLAGFAGEGHEVLEAAGWRAVEWFTPGYLRGGMAVQSEDGHQQARERLFLSPNCLTAALPPSQLGLFA